MAAALEFCLFWAVSVAGYRISRSLKFPAPVILGPILLFVLLTLGGVNVRAPSWQRPLLSMATGVLLGLRFNHRLKGTLPYMALAAVWMFLLSFLAAGALALTGVPKETALFAAIPGGMAEVTLLSLSYHADAFVIVLLQSLRMVCSMVLFSALASRYRRGEQREEGWNEGGKGLSGPRWAVLLLWALLAAVFLDYLKFPSAKLMGPMLAVGFAVRAGNIRCRVNPHIQRLVQIGIGGLAGVSIARENILSLMEYVAPALILNGLIIGGSLVLAAIMIKYTGWDKATCILSCCPAGLSPTIMVAMEYGADANIVTVFQVLRMVTALVGASFGAAMIL